MANFLRVFSPWSTFSILYSILFPLFFCFASLIQVSPEYSLFSLSSFQNSLSFTSFHIISWNLFSCFVLFFFFCFILQPLHASNRNLYLSCQFLFSIVPLYYQYTLLLILWKWTVLSWSSFNIFIYIHKFVFEPLRNLIYSLSIRSIHFYPLILFYSHMCNPSFIHFPSPYFAL